MRKFVQNYNGFEIFIWTTGKYEAYLNGWITGFWSRSLDGLLEQLDRFEVRT